MRRARGYSLLELVAVFTIAAILATGLAFGGAGLLHRVQDSTARSNLVLVLAVQQRIASQYGAFTSWPADLTGLPAGVAVVNDASTGPSVVSVARGATLGTLGLATQSTSGACVFLAVGPASASSLTWSTSSSSSCTGAAALPANDPAGDPSSVRR